MSAIQAYSDTEADFFWRHITEQSGGRLLRLGCFEELVGVMVLGLVYNSYDENQFTVSTTYFIMGTHRIGNSSIDTFKKVT